MITTDSNSVAETEAIAAKLARSFVGGEVIALDGELGAGKTQFVRGLVHGLNGNVRSVSSPTFVLLNIYDTGRLKLFHLDAYRVQSAEDFDAIGFTELLEQNGVVVVEWASRVSRILPPKHIDVTLDRTGENSRRLTIEWFPV